MIRNYITYAVLCIFMFLQACSNLEESFTLQIPEEGFQVVQHIPVDQEGRDQNALYILPREIKKKEFNSNELSVYIDSMYAVMLREAGVGIASNQLGKSLQIFIIEAESSNPRYKVLGQVPKQVFINPRITKTSETRKNFWHGCLSAHGEDRGNVATYEWIEYTCQNEQGEIRNGKLEGFAAVIFQHEFRHMLSGTYLDHANHFLPTEELAEKLTTGELPFFEIANDTLPLLIDGYEVGETIKEYHSRKN